VAQQYPDFSKQRQSRFRRIAQAYAALVPVTAILIAVQRRNEPGRRICVKIDVENNLDAAKSRLNLPYLCSFDLCRAYTGFHGISSTLKPDAATKGIGALQNSLWLAETYRRR